MVVSELPLGKFIVCCHEHVIFISWEVSMLCSLEDWLECDCFQLSGGIHKTLQLWDTKFQSSDTLLYGYARQNCNLLNASLNSFASIPFQYTNILCCLLSQKNQYFFWHYLSLQNNMLISWDGINCLECPLLS